MAQTLQSEHARRPTFRRYPPEVREEAVLTVLEAIEDAGHRYGVIPKVARKLGVGESSLRSWVRQVEEDRRRLARADRSAVRARPGAHGGVRPPSTRRPPVAPRPTGWPRPPKVDRDLGGAGERSTPPAASPAWRRRLASVARDLRRPLAWYLVSRLVVTAAVIVALHQPHGGLVALRAHIPWPRVPANTHFLEAFSSWDAGWYVHIAAHGYVPLPIPRGIFTRDIAFLPVFPFLVRAASAATGASPLATGVVVTFVFGAAAVAGVWYAARALGGRAVADRTAVLWSLFPGAYVLSLVYAEGLTVVCAAACLVGLMRRRWVLAGVAAAVGMATQPDAIVLGLCCAWAAVAAVWSRREWSALIAPVLAPAGAAAYTAWLWVRSGDPAVWVDSERVLWAHGKMGPYWTIVRPLSRLLHGGSADNTIRVVGLALVVGGLLLLWRSRPPATFWLWTAGTLVLAFMSAPVGARPRFLLVAFPMFIAAARKLPPAAVYGIAVVEAGLLGALTFSTITTLRLVP